MESQMRSPGFVLALAALALPFPTLASVGEQAAASQTTENSRIQDIESESVLALKALQLLDQHIHSAGYRLVAANAAYCKQTVPNTGLLLHDIQQYGDCASARFAHGFASDIAVNAVALGSPAAKAGVRVGDGDRRGRHS